MMNSLPRWFGLKSRKDKNNPAKKSQYSSQLEISENNTTRNYSASSHSGQSLSSGSSECFNENLYVNGQVPRGQFKEYFMPPESKLEPEFIQPRERIQAQKTQVQRAHSFKPTLERASIHNSYLSDLEKSKVRNSYAPPHDTPKYRNSFAPSNDRSHVRHSLAQPVEHSSIRGNVRSINQNNDIRGSVRSINQSNDILTSHLIRQGSIRSSLLKKAHSVDDVLDESIVAELVPNDSTNNYYNVQFARKSSSQVILNKQNLEQHDMVYMNKLVQARCRDPFTSSFLGHTLLSERGVDLDSVKAESVESKDSGALSLGGGIRKFIIEIPLAHKLVFNISREIIAALIETKLPKSLFWYLDLNR